MGARRDHDERSEIARARELGDRERLAQVLERHRERLRRLLEFRLDTRLRRRVDPSDVLQEASVEALARIDDYLGDPSVPFFVWLRFIAVQKLQQFHRRHFGAAARDARREVSIHGLASPETTSMMLAESLVAADTSPSDALARSERRAILLEALEAMEPLDREILGLRHFEGLSNGETAEALAIKKSTASSRYIRALKKIREILDRRLGG